MNAIVIYITAKNKEQAITLAKTLLEERLIACANLIESTSLYHWNGELQNTPECILIAKSTDRHMDCITARVTALHDYECPCIVAWPITSGHLPFLEWVHQSVGDV